MDAWRSGPSPRGDATAAANTNAAVHPAADLQEVLVALPHDRTAVPSKVNSVQRPTATTTTTTIAAEAPTHPSRATPASNPVPTNDASNGVAAASTAAAGLRADLTSARYGTAEDPADMPDGPLADGGPADDERVALLGPWQQRSDPPAAATAAHVGAARQHSWVTATRPPGDPSSRTGAVATAATATAAAAACGGAGFPAAQRRVAPQGWSPFELAGPPTAGAGAGLMGSPTGLTRGGGRGGGGGSGSGRIAVERQGSTLLMATTAAGDLLTAVPDPGQAAAGQLGRGSQPGAAGAAAAGGGGGGGGLAPPPGGGSGGDKVPLLDVDNTSQQLTEYLRDEQLRQAAESRSALLSRSWLKRAFMVAVTAGFLAAAIFVSTIPWGRRSHAGLPTWRWFLLVGCLPSVWYLPWFTIFLIVLLLESLLPVAVPGSSRIAGGGSGGGSAQERGEAVGGPAMMVYHILGVRRHMVRVLRSLCGQLLVHFIVMGSLDTSERGTEGTIMKAWTCLTLFLTANTLKSLVAKALSKHFHSRGYLERMQQAVKQELVLMALSRPRPGRSHSDALTHLGLGYHLANIFGYGSQSHRRHHPHHPGSAAGQRGGYVSAGSGHRSPFAAFTSFVYGTSGGGGGTHGPFAGFTGSSVEGLKVPTAPPSTVVAAAGMAPVDSLAPSAVAVTAAAGSRAGSRQFHIQGGLQMYDAPPQQLPPPQRRQQSREPDGRASDGSARGGRALYGASSGGGGGAAAAGSGSGRESFWRWLKDHLRVSYSKTKVQWELSRPSGAGDATGNRRIAVAPPGARIAPLPGGGGGGGGGGGVGVASPGAAGGAEAAGANGLNYDQLKTSLFWLEQHIRRNKLRMGVTLTDRLRAAAEGGEEGNEVTSKTEAKRLAFYLHMNVLGLSDLKGRKYLVARDFEPFFNSVEEIREAFAVFDSDRDGRITLQNMVDTIVRIYKERKKLALTLHDTRTVVAKLELICGVVLHVLFGFFYLFIFQVNVRELWLTFSSVTLAFVFVFGNSIRNIYEAVLFLFVVHPFDVGDWLLLANGEMVKVEEIAMLFCTFLKGDGHRLYYPNTKLIQEPVVNVSRSDTYWDSVTLLVDLTTRGSVVEGVEGRLKRWLVDNPKQYTGSGGVLARALANPSKLQLTASWEYCHTGEDAGRTARWRSKAILVVASALEACGTSYTLPAMKEGRIGQEAAAMVGLVQNDGLAPGLVSARMGAAARDNVDLDAGAALAMQGAGGA